jgi:hypothetical protein
MQQSQNILPIVKTFTNNENVDWQINSSTGVSCDYANQLGLQVLFLIQVRIEVSETMKVPIQIENIKESLRSYIERIRMLPNYSEFMREKIDLSNDNPSSVKQYQILDFICDANIQNVRALEELAGRIREAAQPSEGVEANLTRILELVSDAQEIIYGEAKGLSTDEVSSFVEMFRKLDIQVK